MCFPYLMCNVQCRSTLAVPNVFTQSQENAMAKKLFTAPEAARNSLVHNPPAQNTGRSHPRLLMPTALTPCSL
jgi:hypothetical protein